MIYPQQIIALYNYRAFVLGSVKRDFQAKYVSSALGSFWSIANPLATIIVYTVIFSQIMQARLPGVAGTFSFGIYLCSGMLTWVFFAEIITRCQTVFIENANMLKKLNFPRVCLPAIVVLNASVNFCISFGLFLVILLITDNFPGWNIVFMFPVILVQVLFAIGFGILIGTINVFLRDIGQVVGIILQFWFWFTPIVYPIGILSERLQHILAYNPMLPIVTAYQNIIVYGDVPDWQSLGSVTIVAVLLFGFGMLFFRRHAREMVDEL